MAAAYSASQTAVIALTKAIGKDAAGTGVLVAAPRDHLAWPWSAWEASAAGDGTVQRGRTGFAPT